MNIGSNTSQSPTRQRIALLRDQQWLLFLMFTAFCWSGCRKDEHAGTPMVEILAPFTGAMIQIPDTFLVEVRVSDERTVERITISLNDANGVPITPSISVEVGSPSAVISRAFPVSDERILSGSYTLTVRATNGTNDGTDFRSLGLLEAPLRFRAAFAVQEGPGAGYTVQRIDSAFNVNPFHSGTEPLSGVSISSSARLVHFAGSMTDPIDARDTDQGTTRWQIANLNVFGTPYFTALSDATNNIVHTATNEGFIRGYQAATGSTVLNATCLSGHLTYFIRSQQDRLVTEQVETNTGIRRLAMYASASGVLLDQFPLDKTVIGMFPRTGYEILLFGNRNGEGVIESRDIQSGAYWEPRVFNQGEILAAAPMDANTYFVALPNELVRYTHSNAGAITVNTGTTFHALAFDPSNGVLWGGSDGAVLLIDPSNGATIGTIPISGVTHYLLLLFNR